MQCNSNFVLIQYILNHGAYKISAFDRLSMVKTSDVLMDESGVERICELCTVSNLQCYI